MNAITTNDFDRSRVDAIIQLPSSDAGEKQEVRDESCDGLSRQKFKAEAPSHPFESIRNTISQEIWVKGLVFDLIKSIEKGDGSKILALVRGEECFGEEWVMPLASALAFKGYMQEAFELIRKTSQEAMMYESADGQISGPMFQEIAMIEILAVLVKKNQIDLAFHWGERAVKEGWLNQDEMLDLVNRFICSKYYAEKQFEQLGKFLDSLPSDRFCEKSSMWFLMPLFLAASGRKNKISHFIERVNKEYRAIACEKLLEEGFIDDAKLLWQQVKNPDELLDILSTYCKILARMGKEDEAFKLIEKMPIAPEVKGCEQFGSIQEFALIGVFSELILAGFKTKAFSVINDKVKNQSMKIRCFLSASLSLAGKGRIQEAFDLALQSPRPEIILLVVHSICNQGSEADLEALANILSEKENDQHLQAEVLRELWFIRGKSEDALVVGPSQEMNELTDICWSFLRATERRQCGRILHLL